MNCSVLSAISWANGLDLGTLLLNGKEAGGDPWGHLTEGWFEHTVSNPILALTDTREQVFRSTSYMLGWSGGMNKEGVLPLKSPGFCRLWKAWT